MDIFCTHCGEPWHTDSFFEAKREKDPEWKIKGSKIVTCPCCLGKPDKRVDNMRTSATSMLADLMGDDTDGLAAMLDDFEWAGTLED